MKKPQIQLFQGDCLEVMKSIPDGSIDLILTDPPYVSPTVTSIGRQVNKHIADLSIIKTYYRLIKKEFERILKADGSMFIFCDEKYAMCLYEIFYGWKNTSIVVWDKGRIGMGRPFRKQHEFIFFANRVSSEYNKSENLQSYSSILKCSPVSGDEKTHISQKPVKLLEDLIKGFSNEGNTVLDCFMGSGSTGVACVNTGRSFKGIELDENYFNIAKNRIDEAEKGC